jgi:hypothetical protein
MFVIFYTFPIVLFPLFSLEINYPPEETQKFWLYLVLMTVEIIIHYLKANGGVSRNLKALSFYVKGYIRKDDYLKLEGSICPICFT